MQINAAISTRPGKGGGEEPGEQGVGREKWDNYIFAFARCLASQWSPEQTPSAAGRDCFTQQENAAPSLWSSSSEPREGRTAGWIQGKQNPGQGIIPTPAGLLSLPQNLLLSGDFPWFKIKTIEVCTGASAKQAQGATGTLQPRFTLGARQTPVPISTPIKTILVCKGASANPHSGSHSLNSGKFQPQFTLGARQNPVPFSTPAPSSSIKTIMVCTGASADPSSGSHSLNSGKLQPQFTPGARQNPVPPSLSLSTESGRTQSQSPPQPPWLPCEPCGHRGADRCPRGSQPPPARPGWQQGLPNVPHLQPLAARACLRRRGMSRLMAGDN